MKYFKAKLYEKPQTKTKLIKLQTEKFIGEVIIEDKTSYVVEVSTRLHFDIYDSTSTITPDSKKIKKYGRDLYVKDSDIDYDHPVTPSELNAYIDKTASPSFCLMNEMNCNNGVKKPKQK